MGFKVVKINSYFAEKIFYFIFKIQTLVGYIMQYKTTETETKTKNLDKMNLFSEFRIFLGFF